MVEMTIDSIRMSLMNPSRVVMLKEKYGGSAGDDKNPRYLPIWIGEAEANAIAIKLRNVHMSRPLTHDLLQSILTTLGAAVDRIIVNELKDDTFYARILLSVNGKQFEIDSRPSDALALVVRTKPEAPIYVEEAVLEKAGIILDQETGKPMVAGKSTGSGGEGDLKSKPDAEELKRLSAFTDFINTLNLEDLDKPKS